MDEVLGAPVALDDRQRELTGVWADEAGARFLMVHSGSFVAVQALEGAARQWLHVGEGVFAGDSLRLVAYRQGVNTDTSVAGLDAKRAPNARLDRAGEALAFDGGPRWRRVESVPGLGGLVGVWRTEVGGRVALAHEGESLLVCALDDATREQFSVATARVGSDGRLWAVFIDDGRPSARRIGVPSADTIAWSGGAEWRKDELLRGAAPPPPEALTPAELAVVPNSVEGVLRWEFDWTDVAGASEYRLEIVQADAGRAFFSQEGLPASLHVLERRGGAPARLEGWSWRVAAKVGGEWTAWSQRASFRVAPR